MQNIRNIAIIAHVDHGKTTLVDQLLRQSGTFRSNQQIEERVMDSMDLEREKGITIRAKNAAFQWDGYRINIVDTPGHADFGGEVERIMKMVDGVLLVVDAHDGPQAQTRFVLRKAFENHLKPIVVINKIDREHARPHEVLDLVFDLFLELKATNEQLDFPVIYASAKEGFARRNLSDTSADMTPLFQTIVESVPPPKIRMRILGNDSPFAGREGKFVTARHLRDRLVRETRANVSLQINDTESAGAFEIHARGEMQIAILIEQMRREGYEMMVSRPEVIFHRDESDNLLEPLENLYVDLPEENLGDVLQSLANRKGDVVAVHHHGARVSIEAIIPTRGLIGLETDLINLTRGEGIMSHLFREYAPFKGEIANRGRGVLVSMESGTSTAYALDSIQARGRLFVGPQESIYAGMVVGENARPDDLPVNPCKAKRLTNMRSQGEGKGIQLETPLRMNVERALEYIDIDEYVEATPKSLRLRKHILDATTRKRAANRAA